MKFGVNILNFGSKATPSHLATWATGIESLGFHFAMISDHLPVTPDVHARYPAPFFDPLTTIAWITAQTKSIELGTTVLIVPYRNPIAIARATANIDQFSNGRFILGVGVGWSKLEYEALGVPFHERGAITDDYIQAIKTFWTNKKATHNGKYINYEGLHSEPMPIQNPHPPIWVGGSSDRSLRRSVLLGDAWHPINFRVDWLKNEGIPKLKKMADSLKMPMPALCPRIKFWVRSAPMDDQTRLAGEGTMDQIRKDLIDLENLGSEYVLLDSYEVGIAETAFLSDSLWNDLCIFAETTVDLENQCVNR